MTCRLDKSTDVKRTYQIIDSVPGRNKKYFLYGRVQDSDKDTIRQEIDGRVTRLLNGTDYSWFDFKQDSGAVYTFPFINEYDYNVTVSKHITVRSLNRLCTNISYIFAPGIGLIQKYGAWSDDVLHSAIINGIPVQVIENAKAPPAASISILCKQKRTL
jgi:hypothetical protein